ncbi:hypothetical protein [Nocardia sp. CY41]|uniref:hypothetical protein n=1 Tax=Nocardia sp. CY41 TaxID=2608686 RepID=UPI00135CAC51|nr:hypothetical protein [Nocardia sp. CY41]
MADAQSLPPLLVDLFRQPQIRLRRVDLLDLIPKIENQGGSQAHHRRVVQVIASPFQVVDQQLPNRSVDNRVLVDEFGGAQLWLSQGRAQRGRRRRREMPGLVQVRQARCPT